MNKETDDEKKQKNETASLSIYRAYEFEVAPGVNACLVVLKIEGSKYVVTVNCHLDWNFQDNKMQAQSIHKRIHQECQRIKRELSLGRQPTKSGDIDADLVSESKSKISGTATRSDHNDNSNDNDDIYEHDDGNGNHDGNGVVDGSESNSEVYVVWGGDFNAVPSNETIAYIKSLNVYQEGTQLFNVDSVKTFPADDALNRKLDYFFLSRHLPVKVSQHEQPHQQEKLDSPLSSSSVSSHNIDLCVSDCTVINAFPEHLENRYQRMLASSTSSSSSSRPEDRFCFCSSSISIACSSALCEIFNSTSRSSSSSPQSQPSNTAWDGRGVRQSYALHRTGSDHLPVVLELSITQGYRR